MREAADPIDRGDEELLDVLPESNRKPYDMYEVIRRIVDDGEYFDMKPQWAKTIITCFARFGGRPGGHRRQPAQAARRDPRQRLRRQGRALREPLQRLRDPARVPAWTCPGFMVGTKVEEAGIIRHGAKMLYAVANATVPKITVVLRKAYGAGYYVMNGRAYEPDLIVAWPSAEISVMGAEGAVEIVFRKQVEEAEDPAAKKAELIDAYREIIDVYIAARNGDDRRRHRPARDAPGDLPRARDGRGQARRAAVEAQRGRAGLGSLRDRHGPKDSIEHFDTAQTHGLGSPARDVAFPVSAASCATLDQQPLVATPRRAASRWSAKPPSPTSWPCKQVEHRRDRVSAPRATRRAPPGSIAQPRPRRPRPPNPRLPPEGLPLDRVVDNPGRASA